MKMISKKEFIYIASTRLYNETIKNEKWKEAYLTRNWQEIQDKNFVKFDENGNLLENIRKSRGGRFEIDLSKTEFIDLPKNIQDDYCINIELALELMERNEYKKISNKEVVDFYRFELFKISPWACNDAILNMPYEKLPEVEKKDFLKPYEVTVKQLDYLKENEILVEGVNSTNDDELIK